MSHAQRILILSSNTGGGHQSAATALQESFLRLSPGQVLVNIAQVLEDACPFTSWCADIYNYLLRYHQHYMKYYYWAIEKCRPHQSNIVLQLSMKYGMQLFERLAPTTLVSVHPMTQHFSAYILKKTRLIDKIPLITVVTDPCKGFWQGWACPEVSQYFVANADAKAQLNEYGIPDERIQISGMPVHSRFQPIASAEDKLKLRQALNLDPDRFTILVNAGWIGGGNIPELYTALLEGAPADAQLVFLSGKNDTLRHQTEDMARDASRPVRVLGFTREIDQWMNASDIMISKMGGLTTFEAMACHLPILADCLTPPMPQEQGTARYISDHGAGVLITHPGQVVEELNRLTRSPEAYAQLKAAAASIGKPGAVDTIAEEILRYQR